MKSIINNYSELQAAIANANVSAIELNNNISLEGNIELPDRNLLLEGYYHKIIMNGFKIDTKDFPTWKDQEGHANKRFELSRINFSGNSTITLRNTMGSLVEKCDFAGNELILSYCMNANIINANKTRSKISLVTSTVTGATTSNSGCNNSLVSGNRFYSMGNEDQLLLISNAQNTIVHHNIFEGGVKIGTIGHSTTAIAVNVINSANACKNVVLLDNYFEARFKSLYQVKQAGGVINIDGIHTIYPTVILNDLCKSGTKIEVSGIDYAPGCTLNRSAESIYTIGNNYKLA